MHSTKRLLLAALMLACAPQMANAADTSAVLYHYRPMPTYSAAWNDGRFGAVFAFQGALRATLERAGKRGKNLLDVDGIYGMDMQRALVLLFTLPKFRDLAPAKPEDAAVTRALWERLLPGVEIPDAATRASALVLSYEDTGFDEAAEWNFCQKSPSETLRTTEPCDTNDPTSYLTWGPRGATAGGGREIQAVLIAVDSAMPKVFDAAYGGEAFAVRRFLHLREDRDAPAVLDTERYLCGIWLDPDRAAVWANGLAMLGKDPAVRDIYDRIYASASFDGGKVNAFFRLYARLGRKPTEVDLGFFLDRATHSGGVFAKDLKTNSDAAIAAIAAAIGKLIKDPAKADAWTIRRAIADTMVTNQRPEDRNGRDVVFFVDGAGEANLTKDEQANWLERGPRHAADIGLSDERLADWKGPTAERFATLLKPVETLTVSETAGCPLRVLNWIDTEDDKVRDPQIPKPAG